MARPKKSRSADDDANSGAISDVEAAADGPLSDISKTRSNDRASVQLSDSGTVAWDRVRAGTREQLRKMALDPQWNRELGIGDNGSVTGTAQTANVFDDTVCGYLFGAISSIKVALANRAGYSPAVSALSAYSQEEISALSKPGAKVLNKYLGGAFAKYPEEAELLGTLAMIELGKVMRMREADRLEREKAARDLVN